MPKHLIIFSLFITLFFNACSSYSVTKYFEKDDFYNSALQYTKKTDIVENKNVIAMLNATYLNSVDKKYNNKYENFIVGIYETNNDNLTKNKTLNVTLNDKPAVVVNTLEAQDKLNNIPLKNHWAKYYLISFEKEKREILEKNINNLVLNYTSSTGKVASLTFLKEL